MLTDRPTATHVDGRAPLPGEVLEATRMPGHWLLARMGKRVLRPGGVGLTERLLTSVAISATDDVVELAPGLGATTRLILAAAPATYTGVDRDPASADLVGDLVTGPDRRVIRASAADTGLPDGSADVVFGEAYLTMQPDSLKRRIIAEVVRILRPGGRFALHEIALAPRDISENRRDEVVSALTSSIKVNVSPMTIRGWEGLLEEHGLTVQDRYRAPLDLLEPRRLVADEGIVGASRFVANVARDRDARRRVVAMRRAMRSNAEHLGAYGLAATLAPSARA